MKVYYDKDCDLSIIQSKKVAIQFSVEPDQLAISVRDQGAGFRVSS